MDNTTAVGHVNNKGGTHSPCLSAHIGTPAMMPREEHHDINSARTWQVEHHRRLGIEGVQRKQRVEDSPSNDFPLSQGVRNQTVCFSPIRPASPVRHLASGPRGNTRGCIDSGLGTLQGLRLSTFQSDSSCPKQSVSGQSGHHVSGSLWPAQSWWPLLLNLLIEHPVLLPNSRHLLRDPADPQRVHPMFPRLHLAVFHVSGDSTKQWEFQTMLRKFSFRHPANLQGKHINQLEDAGVAGVLRERLSFFQRL